MSSGRVEDERTWVIVELDERVMILRGWSLGKWSRKEAKVVTILVADWCLVFAKSLIAAQICSISVFERLLLVERCFEMMSRQDKTTLRMGAPMLSRPFFQRCHAANLAFFHHDAWSFVSRRGITSR